MEFFLDELKRKELLQNVFGKVLYNDIFTFFQYIDSLNYHIKIFVSKKSYVLYSEFESSLHQENNKTIYCTDAAIPLIDELIKDTKIDVRKENLRIAVIDDILIHGRTLKRIYDELINNQYNVDLFSFCKNTDKVDIPCDENNSGLIKNLKDIKNKTRSYLDCDNFEWKYISGLIMKSFWCTNAPMLSYSPFLRLNKNIEEQICAKNLNFLTCDFQNHTQQDFGQRIKYIFIDNFIEIDDIFGLCFFIQQINVNVKASNILPYIVFNDEHLKRIAKLKIISCNIAGEKYEFDLNDKFISFKLVSVLHALFYMSYFIKKLSLKNNVDYVVDWRNVTYSFGLKTGNKLKQLFFSLLNDEEIHINQNLQWITKESLVFENEAQQILSEQLSKILKSDIIKRFNDNSIVSDISFQNCNLLKRAIARYLKFNGNFDEDTLKNNDSKIESLSLYNIIMLIYKLTKLPISDIIAAIMEQYFIGMSTIVVEDIDGYCCPYYHAGEQSFKCVVKEFVPLVYFYSIYNQQYCETIRDILFEKLLDFASMHYASKEIRFSKDDFFEYSNLENDNVYRQEDIDKYLHDDIIGEVCRYGIDLRNAMEKILTSDISGNLTMEKIKFALKEYC